jgi:hypothetical protein
MMYFVRRPLKLLLIGIFLAAILTACGGQAPAGEPTPDVNATVAAGAQTMVASVFQTQTASAPTVTNTASPTVTVAATTSPIALGSVSPMPTFTQGVIFFASATPTGTFYTATPNPGTLGYKGCNLLLIESFTEPKGPFNPGQAFTQNWQVANTGTKDCEWLYTFSTVFVSGDRLSGNGSRLGKKIPPGKWTTLSVDLEAPTVAGSYSATWRFAHGDGTPFGSTLPVSIKVEKPKPTAYP